MFRWWGGKASDLSPDAVLEWSAEGPTPMLANSDPEVPLLAESLVQQLAPHISDAASLTPVRIGGLPYLWAEPRASIGPDHWDPKRTHIEDGNLYRIHLRARSFPKVALFRLEGFPHVFWSDSVVRRLLDERTPGIELSLV